MDTLRALVESSQPQMPPELSWGIIVLLSGVLVWALVRYINRLDKILERLDDAIDSINRNLVSLTSSKEDHEKRIVRLEDANKRKR